MMDPLVLAREHLSGPSWTRRELEAVLHITRWKANKLIGDWRDDGYLEKVAGRGWGTQYAWVEATPVTTPTTDEIPLPPWWRQLTPSDWAIGATGLVAVVLLIAAVAALVTGGDAPQTAAGHAPEPSGGAMTERVGSDAATLGLEPTSLLTPTSTILPFAQPATVRGYAEPSLSSAMQVLDGGVPIARYGRDWVLMRHPEQGEFWVWLAALAGVPEFDSLPDAQVPAPPPPPSPSPSVPTHP